MAGEKSAAHKNHVGIGITRSSYNTFKRVAKKNKLSIRELLDRLSKIENLETWAAKEAASAQ